MRDGGTDRAGVTRYTSRPLLRRFLAVFGVDAVLKASAVVSLPVYLMLMSREAYASYSYIASLVGVLALVCNFGLYVAQSKLLHLFPARQGDNALFTINVLLLISLCVVLLPLYGFGWDRAVVKIAFSGTVDYETYRYLIPIGIVLAVYSQMLLNYYLTRELIGSFQRYNLLRLLLGLLATLGALMVLAGDGATIRYVALLAAEALALGVLLPSYLRAMRGRFSARLASKSMALGLPIMASAALGVLTNFGDKYFVERYCGAAEMAVYFVGLTLASAVSLVAMAFQSVWLPSFLKERDVAVVWARTRRMGLRLIPALALLSIGVWLLTAIGLSFNLVERAYSDVLKVLPLQLASSVAASATGLLSAYTIYWSKTHVTVVTGSVAALASIASNYILVQAYGIYGAAAASLAVNLLFALMYLWFVRRAMARLGAMS